MSGSIDPSHPHVSSVPHLAEFFTKTIDNDTLTVSIHHDNGNTVPGIIQAQFIGDNDDMLRSGEVLPSRTLDAFKTGNMKYRSFLNEAATVGHLTVGDVTIPWRRVIDVTVTRREHNPISVRWKWST